MSWYERAACRGAPRQWFFAFPNTPDHDKAIALCKVCPVKKECAAEGEFQEGTWAGEYHGWRATRGRRAEYQCARCGDMFLRDEGAFDRVCDGCRKPVDKAKRRVRHRLQSGATESARRVASTTAGLPDHLTSRDRDMQTSDGP